MSFIQGPKFTFLLILFLVSNHPLPPIPQEALQDSPRAYPYSADKRYSRKGEGERGCPQEGSYRYEGDGEGEGEGSYRYEGDGGTPSEVSIHTIHTIHTHTLPPMYVGLGLRYV